MQRSVFVFDASNARDRVACQDLQNILEHSVFIDRSMEIDRAVRSIIVPLRDYYLPLFRQNIAALAVSGGFKHQIFN
jgi:hypothetical protein